MTTKIEWAKNADGSAGETWNPIIALDENGRRGWHCEKVSDGCANCYAETMNKSGRFRGTKLPYTPASRGKVSIELHEKTLAKPLRWRKPRTVFVCSMTDLFGEWVPFEMIDRVFAVMALCPQHTFQVLTKRPERMAEYCNDMKREVLIAGAVSGCTDMTIDMGRFWSAAGGWPLPGVWLGTSVEDQAAADGRIPHLLKCPAAVRFLSCEPLLGALDLTHYLPATPIDECPDEHREFYNVHCALHWVIVGGESGPGARPMHPDWPRSIRDQCQAAGVPFFFKQWGSWLTFESEPSVPSILNGQDGSEWDKHGLPDLTDHQVHGGWWWPDAMNDLIVRRVRKKSVCRELDGRQWNEMPAVASSATARNTDARGGRRGGLSAPRSRSESPAHCL